jgi:hypothetical protein
MRAMSASASRAWMMSGRPVPRGLDVQAQALLLHRLRVGGIVVVEPGLADAHELRMAGEGHSASTVASGSSAALIGWVPAA